MSVRRLNNTEPGENGDKGFRWEQQTSSINGIQEDDEGNIIATTTDRNRSLRAKKQRITQSVRRGLIRYLVVAVDSSDSSGEKDFKPCRLEAVKINLKKFISEYFDQNPISQLSLTITRDRGSERISELSGNPKNHLHKLEGIKLVEKGGFASLQKTISLALRILKHIPGIYYYYYIIIIFLFLFIIYLF
jgi:transcription initiation factor TFIIH subunit 2